MQPANEPAIETLLGTNNLLLVLPHAHKESSPDNVAPMRILGRRLAEHLHCYTVINAKYKKRIVDMADLRAIRKRKKVVDDFLVRIQEFKNEIRGNNLLPLVIILQSSAESAAKREDVIFGYGQGERGVPQRPHRPTISPSLLSKIRITAEDNGLSTGLADTTSTVCGRESYSLNQLFRRKTSGNDFFDPVVRSLLLTLNQDLLMDRKSTEQTADRLVGTLSPFTESMPLVRRVAMNGIDTVSRQDLRYIFRVHGEPRYAELTKEAYIDELSQSIQRNGLVHPLVLLQKQDGRYKILCGFRRFQAIRKLGWQWVEAKVYNEQDFTTEDFFNISLAENTKRRNLNAIEIGNFLESASQEMGLSNAGLAEQFGESLGIGKPGNKVSHSTIHKYRKLNQLRVRGESAEILSDVINDKLQFAIAAEVLAPIKNPVDRDSLYLEVINNLAPTRPQILQIIKMLKHINPQLHIAIASEAVQKAVEKAKKSKQRAGSFIRLLQRGQDTNEARSSNELFDEKVASLRKALFGNKATKQNFNITRTGKAGHETYTLHIRMNDSSLNETLGNLSTLLNEKKYTDALLDIVRSTEPYTE